MELSPVQDSSDRMIAECRCPPRTAQNSTENSCYPIFKQGPCNRGEYFAPVRQMANNRCEFIKKIILEMIFDFFFKLMENVLGKGWDVA